MKQNTKEVERRTAAALAAIKGAMDESASDSSISLFIAHHLEALEATYWQKQAGTPRPAPKAVLDLLVLRSHWGEDDEEGLDFFDFTLPGDVTDYVISVQFDENGDIEAIEMER